MLCTCAGAVGLAFLRCGKLLESLVESKGVLSDTTYQMLEETMRTLLLFPGEARWKECVQLLPGCLS